MNYLFDPENRFWSFMNKIMDVFFIGILWFVFSLPVVTAGSGSYSPLSIHFEAGDSRALRASGGRL